jgi:hypothetical protein
LTVPGFAREHREMDEELDPREAARARRRDRDADAAQRDLLRPGMGKVFKQITDRWSNDAPRARQHARKTTPRDS